MPNSEANIARDVAEGELQAAYSQDQASYAAIPPQAGIWARCWQGFLALVEVIRGLMRPAITLFLLAICSMVAFELYDLANALAMVDASAAWPLFQQVVNALLFLCTTAVTWWFGSRPNQQRTPTN